MGRIGGRITIAKMAVSRGISPVLRLAFGHQCSPPVSRGSWRGLAPSRVPSRGKARSCLTAHAAASARLITPSLAKMLVRCVLTVRLLRKRLAVEWL